NISKLNNIAIVSGGRKRSWSGSFEPLELDRRLSLSVDAIVIDSIRSVNLRVAAQVFLKMEPTLIYRDALEGGCTRTHVRVKRSLSLDSLDPIKRPILFPVGKAYTNMAPKKLDNRKKTAVKGGGAESKTYEINGMHYECWNDHSIVLQKVIVNQLGQPSQTKLVIDGHQAKHCDAMNFLGHYKGEPGSKFVGFTGTDFLYLIDELYAMNTLMWVEQSNPNRKPLSWQSFFAQEPLVITAPNKRVAYLDSNQWKRLLRKDRDDNNAPCSFSKGACKFFQLINTCSEPISIAMHSSFTPRQNNQNPFWAIHIFPEFPKDFNMGNLFHQVKIAKRNNHDE
ncbi:MAG: hypothetical protein EB051_05740, partial [Chlamydiia bacterium]|nr:hypothetical protein [Chlamydiia bacterium]